MQLHYFQGRPIENDLLTTVNYIWVKCALNGYKKLLIPCLTVGKKELPMIDNHYVEKYASTAKGLTLILKMYRIQVIPKSNTMQIAHTTK